MANDRQTDRSKLSRDRETIRGWVEDHGGQPVRNGATGDVDIVVGEPGEPHRAIAWDSFFDEMDRIDGVVIYHGEDGDGTFEVVERGRALGRTEIDSEEVERALLEGETTGAGGPDEGMTEAEAADRERGELTVVSRKDQGKDVVGEEGEDLGTVSEVEGGTLYIDPDPSLTERIEAKFDWDDMEEGGYPVGSEKIKRITDDEVVLVSSSEHT